MGGVVSWLTNLFSSPPARPPPHVQKIAEPLVTPSPCVQKVTKPPATRSQADVASGIINEARRKVGVDCMKHYNFAVCGQSGVGKSAFINGFLALEGAAASSVGEAVETTKVIQRYSTKRAPHLMVWDIPGAGTLNHPANTYFENKKLYVFDAILILSSTRFLEVDFEILRCACKYGTPCVFIWTKCDISVHGRAQQEGISTLIASQHIRKDVESSYKASLAKAGLKDLAPIPKLFLISSNLFSDDDAYHLYNKKTKTLDTSLSSMDEHALTYFIYETAKVRAPPSKDSPKGGQLAA